MKELVKWAEPESIRNAYSAAYWNDPSQERDKPFWISDASDLRLKQYLRDSGLLEEFDLAIVALRKSGMLGGKVLDVASGVCWTSALLSKVDAIEQVDALEFSWHRIHDLAPRVIENLGGKPEKIQRTFGSFYDIASHHRQYYDLVMMSQAFHHADQPLRLLQECDAALKNTGTIVLIGEHLIDWVRFIKRVVRTMLYERRLTFDFFDLFKPDEVTGDHYYRPDHYDFLFRSMGYRVEHLRSNISGSLIIIATRHPR